MRAPRASAQPWDMVENITPNPKGVALTIENVGPLIPHVSFVDFYSVTATDLPELILKRHRF